MSLEACVRGVLLCCLSWTLFPLLGFLDSKVQSDLYIFCATLAVMSATVLVLAGFALIMGLVQRLCEQ